MNDLFLIRQVLEGNRNAFKFLVLRYQRPLFQFLKGMGVGQEAQEEIAQEAFLRAFKSLSSYSPEKGATFSTWLFTIAKNLAINEGVRKSNQMVTLVEDEFMTRISDPRLGAQSLIEIEQEKTRIKVALDSLPIDFKKAVTLSFLQELSIQEIAQIENCSLGTVKSRIFRGKQLLRILLKNRVEV